MKECTNGPISSPLPELTAFIKWLHDGFHCKWCFFLTAGVLDWLCACLVSGILTKALQETCKVPHILHFFCYHEKCSVCPSCGSSLETDESCETKSKVSQTSLSQLTMSCRWKMSKLSKNQWTIKENSAWISWSAYLWSSADLHICEK